MAGFLALKHCLSSRSVRVIVAVVVLVMITGPLLLLGFGAWIANGPNQSQVRPHGKEWQRLSCSETLPLLFSKKNCFSLQNAIPGLAPSEMLPSVSVCGEESWPGCRRCEEKCVRDRAEGRLITAGRHLSSCLSGDTTAVPMDWCTVACLYIPHTRVENYDNATAADCMSSFASILNSNRYSWWAGASKIAHDLSIGCLALFPQDAPMTGMINPISALDRRCERGIKCGPAFP